MATTKDNIDEIAAYSSEEENIDLQEKPEGEEGQTDSTTGSGVHISLHSAGFKELLLKPEIVRAIGDAGFEHPSEVQHECIPQAILGTDVLCQAKSGMGKTAVFVVSVLQQLDVESNDVACLVLCHARELAFQIKQEFDRMKKYLPSVRTKVLYGGTPIASDKKELTDNNPQIVIGTPGRVLHLARENSLKLNRVKFFILDECDKMLETADMRADVQQIFKLTPHSKQVMMFSATLPEEIRTVAKRFMHHVGYLSPLFGLP